MDLNVITGGVITNNDFAGAQGVVQPETHNQDIAGLTQCANTYGADTSQVDASCTSVGQPTGTRGSPRFWVQRHRYGDRGQRVQGSGAKR
jgi:hypothetical protein